MPTQKERDTLNQRELDKLTRLYRQAQADILNTFDSATDFGQARRLEQLAQIDRILTQLGRASGDYVSIVLGNSYERGTVDALGQLTAINVGIKDGTTMSVIDRRAVEALVSETQELFGQSLTRVKGAATKALSTAVREQITDQLATGRIVGETLKSTVAAIKATIKEQGITALVDKSGREWTLDRYADMLARTKMVEARNTGLANKMLANGYDLVQVSNHASTHSACAHYESKILSLSGLNKKYPSIADAKANGLFHPNCRHQINVIQTDYAALTKAYDPTSGTYKAPFSGNKPAVNPKPTVALKPKANTPITVEGGSFSGAPVVNNKVTLGIGKSQIDFKFNKLESDFISQTSLRITTLRNPFVRRVSRTTNAYYMPSTHSIHIANPNNKAIQHTMLHELGHALDHVFDKANGTISNRPEIKAALKADAKNILATRMVRNYDGKYSFDDMLKLVTTGRLDVEGGYLQFSGKFRTYAASASEVFGDAYAQYRLNPTEFAKLAPTVFKMFKDTIK